MTETVSTKSPSRIVREHLPYPTIDGDGHVQELDFVLPDFLKQVGGPTLVSRWEQWLRTPRRDNTRLTFWNVPSGKGTLDRAMSMLPKLRKARQDDCGIDFAIVYTTRGFGFWEMRDDELRQGCCRALNMMNADIFSEVSDRMTPAAVIPMNTPAEAIAELDFAVGELGMKTITIKSEVRGPVPEVAAQAPELAPYTDKVHSLTIDSEYDYDPFWRKCIEYGVAPANHSGDRAGSSRRATTNFVFNHLGSFATGNDFLCRSLFMGGVTRRFPELNFAFLEGGVGWAAQLYNDIVEHWEKRNVNALVENLNPADLDMDLMAEMFETFGDDRLSAEGIRGQQSVHNSRIDEDPGSLDEFADCAIERGEDIRDLFTNSFYFGCESDDRMMALAFNSKLNHFGANLKAFWGSDIGHWDVTDATHVLQEAYGMVEEELIDESDFREFVFENPATLHARMNPDFFKGTVVENEVSKLLAS